MKIMSQSILSKKNKVLHNLITNDMKRALGCTEPAVIALVSAKARSLSKEEPVSVEVEMNSGIYKNAYTCGIAGTDKIGAYYAAALGVISGKEKKGLMVLEETTANDQKKADEWIKEGRVKIVLKEMSSVIRARAVVSTENDICIAEIVNSHTNFSLLQFNDEVLYKENVSSHDSGETYNIIDFKFEEFINFVNEASYEELRFIEDSYKTNYELAMEGAAWSRCVISGALIKLNDGKVITDNVRTSAKALTASAIEARFLGAGKPAMSITGSGAHGIISTLPLYAVALSKKIEDDRLVRAIALNFLVTMYVKECSGKLSAFCGCGVAGGIGLAYALPYLLNCDDLISVGERAINNMASSITGMICSGGNQACTMKAIAAVDAAFNAVEIALLNSSVSDGCGILGDTIEMTAKNVGKIASPGMVKTEDTILDIMVDK